jgi:cohesin loading factor subunit SCC2
MPFCALFGRILDLLLRSLEDNQATTRSKALKSVFQLIQRSPEILDRPQVIQTILKLLKDPSPLVRDSVVDVIGKCISLQPSLEHKVYNNIIDRSADPAAGVRKRSMKILKEIYLRNDKVDVKVAIAEALLQRIKDADSAVSVCDPCLLSRYGCLLVT